MVRSVCPFACLISHSQQLLCSLIRGSVQKAPSRMWHRSPPGLCGFATAWRALQIQLYRCAQKRPMAHKKLAHKVECIFRCGEYWTWHPDGLDGRGSVPCRGRDVSPLHSVQTDSGAHPASYPKCIRGLFSGEGAEGRGREVWSYISTPRHVFMHSAA
jgi:hypothetical protein